MNTEILHKATKKRLVPQLRFPEFEDEWRGKKIGQLLKIGSGKDYKHLSHGKIPVFGTGGLMCYVNDFLFSGKTVFIGRKGSIDKPFYFDGMFWTVDTLFYTYEFKNTIAQFIYALFQKIDWYKHNEASGVPSLSKRTIETIIVNIPSLPEQQKIASFLSAVDEKIQQLTRKRELLEQYKKGVMQQLFSGKLRFKDDKGKDFPEWKEKRLGKLLIEYKQNSIQNNQYEVLTSSNKGLIRQSDYFGEGRLTSKENIGFNIIPNGFLTYRSRSDNRKFTFNENKLGVTGLISTYYPVFKMKNSANNYFIELTNYFQNYIGKYSVGTSQTVLSFNELKKIKFEFPCDKEQQKIADFLSSIDVKIENVNQQLNQAQQFKKGLLQQLFV